jgi:hypothetical protein
MSTPFVKKIPGRAGAVADGIDRGISAHRQQQSILFSMRPESLIK